ncbi:MAG: hypothetical protein U0326_32920 [Polyangiales bacterium]
MSTVAFVETRPMVLNTSRIAGVRPTMLSTLKLSRHRLDEVVEAPRARLDSSARRTEILRLDVEGLDHVVPRAALRGRHRRAHVVAGGSP